MRGLCYPAAVAQESFKVGGGFGSPDVHVRGFLPLRRFSSRTWRSALQVFKWFRNFKVVSLLGLTLLLCGCVKVNAWERGTLAKPIMALEPDPLEARFRAHVYEVKQASSGGYGVGGGGCGCK